MYYGCMIDSGTSLHALGARMRMVRARVGAMHCVLTGVSTFSAWTPAPIKMIGKGM